MQPVQTTSSRFLKRHDRRGAVILEFILVLPVLLIASLAILEFGYLLLVGQAVNTATIEGARKASELGGEANSGEPVAETVREFLAVHQINLSLTQPAAANFGDAYMRIDYGEVSIPDRMGASLQSYEWGNSNYQVGAPAGIEENEVVVTVQVPVNDGTVQTIPDLLSYFGFSLSGYTYQFRALARLE